MIKTIALIKLYKNGRKMPFYSRYRPLFNFIEDMKTTGQIVLLDRESFSLGEEGLVEVDLLYKEYLGENFGVGSKFTFSEGNIVVGEGKIKEILLFAPEKLF